MFYLTKTKEKSDYFCMNRQKTHKKYASEGSDEVIDPFESLCDVFHGISV